MATRAADRILAAPRMIEAVLDKLDNNPHGAMAKRLLKIPEVLLIEENRDLAVIPALRENIGARVLSSFGYSL